MTPTDSTPTAITERAALRVALAAGGTGGHLMPALATAEALARRTTCEFLVVGSSRQSERNLRSLVPYPVVEVKVRALLGRGLAGRLVTLAALPAAIIGAARHLRRFRPHLVIATGGYVCGPTGIAARLLGVPLLVLEQNATPGLTTRWLRPFAAAIAVSFEQTVARLGSKAVCTGNPVRESLPAAATRDGSPPAARNGGGVNLLVLGGSQGAQGLNTMVELAIPRLADADVAVVVTHQSGQADLEMLRECYAKHGLPATVVPFIHEIGEAYAQAHLVCARAGATTLAELTFCGLPSILVPYPHAAGGHQHANAEALRDAGAALLVEQRPDGTELAESLIELLSDRERIATMAAAAAAAGHDAAADTVADLALSLVGARIEPTPPRRSPAMPPRPTPDPPVTERASEC